MHKRNEDGKKYHGDWQEGSVIQQKLDGPIGDGSIDYPNGDRFEGYFHLSFAHINGPAYMADGNYTFANGDWIENCWIDGNDRLCGVYETLHADGTRSFAMWYCGQKQGFEAVPTGDSLAAREYRDGEAVASQQASHYTFTPSDDGCNQLEVELSNGDRVVYRFDYNNAEPTLRCRLYTLDGDWIEYNAYSEMYNGQPWDGWFIYHRAKDGMKLDGHWKNGQPEGEQAWEHDDEGARKVSLADPYGSGYQYNALVWPDGHIRLGYSYNYVGDVVDDKPEGHGELFDHAGRRYEGEFHEGLCHGHGVYTFEKAGIRQSGRWEQGHFLDEQKPETPVMLKVHWRHNHCSPAGEFLKGEEEWTIEAKTGPLDLPVHTCGITLEAIEPERIILTTYGNNARELNPGKTVGYLHEVEGREWSDGCVYESDEYTIEITWKQ